MAEWLKHVPDETVFLSALTIGEIRRGIDRLAAGKRRTCLEIWLAQGLINRFAGRILPVDAGVAERWGGWLAADAERRKSPLPLMDVALLIATAWVNGLTLVTRDAGPARIAGVAYFDPWV